MSNKTRRSYLFRAVVVALLSLAILAAASPVTAVGPTVKWVDAQNGNDANDGNTEATAYASLQKAIDESESGTASDRSIVYVKDGTYGITGQTSCEGFPAAIAINNLDYLTIQAVDGHEPVVKPLTAAESNIVSLGINNANHLVIDNIDSDQTIAQFDNWHVCSSNDLTVRNSKFAGGEDGIDFGTGFIGALIENNHFVNIDTGSGDEVLDFTDGAYADVTIQDNIFANNYRQITIDPPTVGQATNFIIRRNMMDGTTSQEAVRLIGPNGVTLENNVIMNSTQQGLYIDSGTSNVNIWHNTFFNNGEEEIRTKVNSVDIVIKNNVIYANGLSAALSADTKPLPGEDYNLLFNYGTETESSQPAVTSFGANTIIGQDPLFVSTVAGSEDLHLQATSPALAAGTNLGVADDLEQNPRPNPASSAPDLGAYEMPSPDTEGPITTNVVADPNPVAVEATVALTANVDDTTTGESTIKAAEYSINGGAWMPMNAEDNDFDEVTEDVAISFTAPDEAGVYSLCVRGTDAANNVGLEECIMFVVYDPDGGFVTGGGWIDSPAGAMDPMPALVWDQGFEVDTSGWSDSNNGWYGTVAQIASGTNGITSASGAFHAQFEGDADSAPFSRFDGYRDTWTGSWTAEIGVYLDPAWPTGQGFDYSVAASRSSGAHLRDYIFHVGVVEDYGTVLGKALLVNGSNNADFYTNPYKLVNDNGGNYYVVATAGWYTLQHIFRDAGGYLAVDLNLLDSSGKILWTATRENVADTIPGEVGGNRYAWFTHIDVDGGIYADNHELVFPVGVTGKANFGFVSKYKKGASVPTGSTTFVFQAADFNFHSNVQDWLVVTGSDYAKFKGSGTVNGALDPNGNMYKFMVWAGDGADTNTDDTFRIKIWWEDNGSEIVVYDNGMDQAIGGGNIVVHTGKK